MTYRVEYLSVEAVTPVVEEWRRLSEASSVGNVFLGPDWYLSWAGSFGAGRDHCVLTVRNGDALVGVMPLVRDWLGPIAGERLSFAAVFDTDPDFIDLLCADGHEHGVLAAATRAIQERFSAHSYIEFPAVGGNSRLVGAQGVLGSLGKVSFTQTGVCPSTTLQADFKAFLRSRFDKKKRYNLERQVRMATDELGLQLHQPQEPEAIARELEKLFELHAIRKAATNTVTRFLTPRSKAFHRELAVRLARQGQLGLFLLADGEQAFSAMYGFYSKNNFYFYQSGLSTAHAKYSLGTALLTMVLQRCCERGLSTFHFMRGNESYKSSWADQENHYGRLRIYRASPRGMLCRASQQGRSWLASVLNGRRRSMPANPAKGEGR